jgi:hypothetical protein
MYSSLLSHEMETAVCETLCFLVFRILDVEQIPQAQNPLDSTKHIILIDTEQ